ncbi:serine/threonine-protein kinase [Polyangium sp. 15x6]|uniref:serine/threonine-protein kinase n=1 Tax=Polyangium sp. 15x6 TaxID=3042687 RepID=UPI00249A131A|nr:serine/threonine-protein kinase [Polyangium sp. 15x6]MDI3283002.1 serine/threonine-protein kinase [Polyangium sp. 15x6]
MAASSAQPSIVVGPATTNLTGIGSAATGYGSADSFVAGVAAAQRVCPTCNSRFPGEYKVCPKDGAELQEENQDELVGQTLRESYTIVRVIGEGGMGRVYEARHTRIGSKRFAIKMLHPEYARQPDVLSRFQREAEAAAQIKSPHVIDVYDIDRTADGRPFIISELLDGKEFADLLTQRGKMAVPQAVRIVRQVCKALAAAHAKGVVHRDMKPENVFLIGDLNRPTAKVIDFGISKVEDNATGKALTRTGMIMGTPAYMAPEQARGHRVDHRADIYAVGAMLYCALTGKRPFDHGDPAATLMAVLSEDPQRPRALEPSIPETLEMVIQRAMAKEPDARHQSMAELDADLAPWDTEEPASAAMVPVGDATATGTAARPSALFIKQQQEATMARPMLVLMTALGIFFTLGGLITTAASIFRITRGGGATANLTVSESVLLLLLIPVALATPIILFIRHMRKAVWANTVKAIELLGRLRRPVVVGLCAYGFGSMLVRLIESVLLRRAVGVAWPVWDVLLLVIALFAALIAHLMLDGDSKKAV